MQLFSIDNQIKIKQYLKEIIMYSIKMLVFFFFEKLLLKFIDFFVIKLNKITSDKDRDLIITRYTYLTIHIKIFLENGLFVKESFIKVE